MKRLTTTLLGSAILLISFSAQAQPLFQKSFLGDAIAQLTLNYPATNSDVTITGITFSAYPSYSGVACSGNPLAANVIYHAAVVGGSGIPLPYATDDRTSYDISINGEAGYTLLDTVTQNQATAVHCFRLNSITANKTYTTLPVDYEILCTNNSCTDVSGPQTVSTS